MPARLRIVLLAAVLLGTGCNTGGSDGELVEVTQRVQRGVTPGQRMLVFDSFNGDIALQDTSAEEAELTFVKRARAGSREEARELLNEINIEERGGPDEFAYRLTSSAPGRTSVDVRGYVPQDTRLRLHLRNGDVALSGLQGPLDVNNENGDIRIGGAAQTTRAETRNGAVEVGMRRLPAEAEVHLRTANGDLMLTLPGTASADVEARTDAGEIDVRGLSFADQDLDQQGAGARFEGELGEGEAAVRLRTENGDVLLRQGIVRRLPSVEGDTSRSAPPDTSRSDTTSRDSLLIPPMQPGGDTSRGTSGAGAPPPLLRRPGQRSGSGQGGASGGSEADTSERLPAVPGLPSLRRDTVQQR